MGARRDIMKKPLSEMTLDELWELFPIVLTEHDPHWADVYGHEVEALASALPSCVRFYHIGSTAINGIKAKPIVDIIVATDDAETLSRIADILQASCGYTVMSRQVNRISLNKGYTEDGYAKDVFHLHVRLKDDIDEVYFRDHLNAHPSVAADYEKLKLRLRKEYGRDRDAYTAAKSEFVNKYTRIAKLEAQGQLEE
ncbi:MAG: GrpB family protein [Roseburia sp.]|nr:GrpB family protein [Roseburia sp.]